MTEEEAVEIVFAGMEGPDSLPMKLVQRQGFDEAQYARVTQAMGCLIRAWQGREVVPKALAYAFVDIRATLQMGQAAYPVEVQHRIEDACDELADLAYLLFAQPSA